jgi:putative ABC transport system permease protein
MYRWLLRLYPTSFRNEYGVEMSAVFTRRRREASTAGGVAALWLGAIVDTCANAALVHYDILRQDLRFTARTLRRAPGFALTSIVIISLGIGATTAAFSVTDFVLIRPLPFPDADRLVKVWERRPGFRRLQLSPANYRDWKRSAHSFEALAAYRGLSVNLVGSAEPQHLEGAAVTADLFTTLGIAPLIGHPFSEADDREGAPGTVLLSYRLWQTQFGGELSVVGTTVDLDNRPYTVIGVMPRDFHFHTRAAQLWTPMRFAATDFTDRNDNYLHTVGRLRRGVSLETARAEMDLRAAQLKQQYPTENARTDAAVFALRDEISEQARLILLALSGAAACVLLIACANLANLLLARALGRRRELAVRSALGAGRERVLRQLLTETLVLAGLGGALGIALAAGAVPLLSQLVPDTLPIAGMPSVDLRVLTFAAVATVLTGIGFGMVPLLRFSRDRDHLGLRENARTGTDHKERLRAALVIAQITASVVLLVSCGLLMRALWRIQATDPGFTTDRILTLRTVLPMPKYEATVARVAFYTRVLSEVRALPGVSSAAYLSFLPMTDGAGGIWPVGINGVLSDRREHQVASLCFATPGLFRTLAIPFHRGRDVTDSDTNDRPHVAIVSESFARRYWPGQDPIGRHFNFAYADREVVGVVGDIHVRGLARSSDPQVYAAYRQVPDKTLEWYAPKDLVVRVTGDPLALVPTVRAIIRKADAQEPIADVRTLAAIVDDNTAGRTAQLRLIGAFTALALLLGAVGIYGLLSFSVSERAQEIGVRMALGAQPGDIVSMVMRRSVALAMAGIVPGVALAYASGRTMQALLAGVSPSDTRTFATAIGLAVGMVIAGSLLPAWRAVRVDPITAVRLE